MIQVRGLTKYYGNFAALKEVSFDVAKGEILGFLGPNAAGKTTTMRILTGYMPPTAGQAHIAGYDVFEQSLDARRHIGYLPESVPLYREMTVRSYLEFMGRLRGMRRPHARVEAVMARTQTDHMANRAIGKLSKGYRQRVGLAQALLHDPEVLVLDEPTVGLDPGQIIEVRDLIRELGQDHTIILSTHILSEVEQVCHRIMIINEGQIVAEDSREQLRARLKGSERVRMQVARGAPAEVAATLRGVPDVRDVLIQDGGIFQVLCTLGCDLRPRLASTVIERGWDLLELRPDGMSLEEIFLKLTRDEDAHAH